MARTVRGILVVAFLVGCGSSSSSSSPVSFDAAAEQPQDSSGGAREVSGDDVDGDCTPATAFTCVASCADATPTTLICDDGHWECEHGVDPRQCAAAGI
jgi:hypothetical protein